MSSLHTILEELKNVPVERLDDIYSIVHSLQKTNTKSEQERKKILSFAGAFKDLSEFEYNDFLMHTTDTRKELFDRHIDL